MPADTSVPSVRVKRATAMSRMSRPATGIFSRKVSKSRRFAGTACHERAARNESTDAPISTSHQSVTKSETPIRITVGSGSAPPVSMIGFITRGSTKTMSTTTLAAMRPAIMSG